MLNEVNCILDRRWAWEGLGVEGNRSSGRPKKYWLDAMKDDLRQWSLHAKNYQNHNESRNRLKTARCTHAGHVT